MNVLNYTRFDCGCTIQAGHRPGSTLVGGVELVPCDARAHQEAVGRVRVRALSPEKPRERETTFEWAVRARREEIGTPVPFAIWIEPDPYYGCPLCSERDYGVTELEATGLERRFKCRVCGGEFRPIPGIHSPVYT